MTCRRLPSLSLLPFLAILGVLLAACSGGDGNGPANRDRGGPEREPRPFLMGVSSLPTEPGEDAYRNAFELAAEAGEVVLIQRSPPWSDFLPGATISQRTERLTRLEKELAQEQGLRLFLAIDATEQLDRGRLAGLPGDLVGKDFSDARVRAAFIAYAKYLALNYKPAYLAVGVEVDMFYARRGDEAFRNFQSVYFEAYDAVKSVSSATKVFPTFQMENLQGLLKAGETIIQNPVWSLVNRFEPKIDLLAVSSFPGLVFRSVDEMPQDYYLRLRGRLDRPVVLASIGWTSATRPDALVPGPDEQFAYLRRVFAASDELRAEAVVWYLSRDPLVQPGAGFEPLSSSGLYDAEGRPKSSWSLWHLNVQRRAP